LNIIAAVMAVFSLLGALDRVLGNRFGLGKEFEKGFMLFGPLALSMIGMIVVSPLIAQLLSPALMKLYKATGVDPSLIMGSLFANDLGGASLARETAVNPLLGRFNGLIVSSMMGGTISFTIPYALETVSENRRSELLTGLLCGVATLPVGCFAGGLVLGVPMGILLMNLLPLLLLSALIAAGLLFFPNACMRAFRWLGTLLKVIITIGLALSILKYLTGLEPVPGLGTLEDAAAIVLNCSVVLTGAFPLLRILAKLLGEPLRRFAAALKITETAAMGFISTLASSLTTFESMEKMDKKGALLNAAFTVSAAFVFADHLAFTLSFDPGALSGMIAGKLIAGVLSIALAAWVYRLRNTKAQEEN